MVVSDNGACFTSSEFAEFMSRNGINHVTTAPYHASSNGLAERAVQTFKSMLKKCAGVTIETKVARVLFSYRITPQSTTGKSPSELLMGRKLRSTLDLVQPDVRGKVRGNQWKQKEYHDKRARERSFSEGDAVYTRNFSYGPAWLPGTVEKLTGPVSCTVLLGNRRVVKRHIDQVRCRPDVALTAAPQTEDRDNLAPTFLDEVTTGEEAETPRGPVLETSRPSATAVEDSAKVLPEL